MKLLEKSRIHSCIELDIAKVNIELGNMLDSHVEILDDTTGKYSIEVINKSCIPFNQLMDKLLGVKVIEIKYQTQTTVMVVFDK